jgi:hypothetical protein
MPKDGKDGEVKQEQVAKAVADYLAAHPIPKSKDGLDGIDGKDGAAGRDGSDGADGQPGRDGEDGKSVTLDDVMPVVMEKVQKALEAIPIPKDGRDGKDGSSVTINQIKSVIESYSAEWALDFEKRAHDILQRTIDRMPKPKDGKDGRDALDLEDFDVSIAEDGRTMTVALIRGATRVERTIKLPIPIYREVWKQDQEYEIGDATTWDGSLWIALAPSKNSKPGEYNKLWRLAVKKGRNGKDSEPPKDGDK